MENMTVFYYNKWRGVDLPELRECFAQLSAAEVAELKKDDEVWIDDEPYHLNGKVYGYTRTVCSDTTHSDYSFPLFKCVDPKRLEALIKEHGDEVLSPIPREEREAFEALGPHWERMLNPN
jgi:hypothetical protein